MTKSEKKEYMKLYRQSKKGLISKIYSHQKQTSKKRQHNPPSYSKEELTEWLYSQSLFHELFNKWKQSDFQSKYIPSIDRKDDNVGYTLENNQIMTWEENNKKSHKDRKSGKLMTSQNKIVIQFDKEWNKINEFHSTMEASRKSSATQGNIAACCRGIRNSAGGFIWKYKTEES